jgi:NAD(P)-dependent dehydrogenase (short-subunit alcohol dehydrogenase family)
MPSKPELRLLDGRVALVAGGGRGIGNAVAAAMAAAGAKVMICDKGTAVQDASRGDEAVSRTAVADLVALGHQALGAAVDVTDADQVGAAFRQAQDAWGPVDIVVNAAGIIRDRMLWNVPSEEWDAVTSVHLKGTFSLASALARQLRETDEGERPADVSLTTFTSSAGVFGNIGSAAYGSAKAGVVGFTRIAAMELARYGVRANCVLPFAYTRMADELPLKDERARQRLEEIRGLSTTHIADLVVWLAACRDPALTGQLLGMRGRELMVFSQPQIQLSAVLERTDPAYLNAHLSPWLVPQLPRLRASGEVFGYPPFT